MFRALLHQWCLCRFRKQLTGFTMRGRMADTYEVWLDQVSRCACVPSTCPMEDWQGVWSFDFSCEHDAGTTPDEAAMKANRYLVASAKTNHSSRTARKRPTAGCPRDHQGNCQPVYERGDYLKVEFPDETTGIGEWMWMIVDHNG